MRSAPALCALAVALSAAPSLAQTPPPPQPTAIVDVRLSEDTDAARVSILIREGRVSEILDAGVELPAGFRVIQGEGGLALPAFIDGGSTLGMELPAPEADQDAAPPVDANVHIGMREANRKGLRPSLEAVDVLALEDRDVEAYREQGFAAVHSTPGGELLAGQSCVTTLSSAALRERVVADRVFMAAELAASGPGYPSTLMGYLSHLRQFLLDARWHAQRLDRYGRGLPDRRPPHDPELLAVQSLLAKRQRLLCQANSARDIRRWMRLAEEQGLSIAIRGGHEAWSVAAELAAAEVPVVLSLDWGEEVEDPDAEEEEAEEAEAASEEAEPAPEATEAPPEGGQPPAETDGEAASQEEETAEVPAEEADVVEQELDWTYEEPLGVRRERRRRWEERRDCALRLHEAGVTFVFATLGQSPKDLLESVRTLVELGLPEEAALAALTRGTAEVLGLSRRLGKLEAGQDADIAVWSDSPFAKKAKLQWLVIDGASFELAEETEAAEAPAEGVDLSGTWEVTYEDQTGDPAVLELDMHEDGEVAGTLSFESPDGSPSSSEVSGRLSGRRLTLEGKIDLGQFSARIRITAEVGEDAFSGDATWKFSGGEDSNSFTARRKPDWSDHGHDHGTTNRGGDPR